jgi:hypothetical protein
LPLEFLHDGGRVLVTEIGEKRRQLRRRDAQNEEGEKADKRDGDGDHRSDAWRTECLGELKQTLHRSSSPARKTLRAAHSARFAQFMVSAGLIAVDGGGQNRGGAIRDRRRANAMTASGVRAPKT